VLTVRVRAAHLPLLALAMEPNMTTTQHGLHAERVDSNGAPNYPSAIHRVVASLQLLLAVRRAARIDHSTRTTLEKVA
jgi:hypothetical protein